MFNIFLPIQSHRKSPLHPKLCPEPGGPLGCHHHSMPVRVASSRRRSHRAATVSCSHRRRSLPCPSGGRGTARQGTEGTWRGSGATLALTRLWIRWRWQQPLGHHAYPRSAHRCYQSPRKDWEPISLVFSTCFSRLSAGPMPGNKTFINVWVHFLLVLILHCGVGVHPCLTEIPNSQFWKFCRLTF